MPDDLLELSINDSRVQPIDRTSKLGSTNRILPAVNDYDPIAPMFDAVMGYDFHAATHHLRQQVVERLPITNGSRCLDLCCGTGLFFDRLSESISIEGWGIDLSRGQIEMARRRRNHSNGQFHYTIADVSSAEFPEHIDLVSINFDALNHLRSRGLWRNLFVRINRAMKASGALVLDVNLPARLTHDWNSPEVIVKDDVTYVQLANPCQFEDGGVIRQTPMIIFSRSSDGLFVRRDALIEQFAVPLQELLAMLHGCGFANLEILQVSNSLPIGHLFNKNRAFVSARK